MVPYKSIIDAWLIENRIIAANETLTLLELTNFEGTFLFYVLRNLPVDYLPLQLTLSFGARSQQHVLLNHRAILTFMTGLNVSPALLPSAENLYASKDERLPYQIIYECLRAVFFRHIVALSGPISKVFRSICDVYSLDSSLVYDTNVFVRATTNFDVALLEILGSAATLSLAFVVAAIHLYLSRKRISTENFFLNFYKAPSSLQEVEANHRKVVHILSSIGASFFVDAVSWLDFCSCQESLVLRLIQFFIILSRLDLVPPVGALRTKTPTESSPNPGCLKTSKTSSEIKQSYRVSSPRSIKRSISEASGLSSLDNLIFLWRDSSGVSSEFITESLFEGMRRSSLFLTAGASPKRPPLSNSSLSSEDRKILDRSTELCAATSNVGTLSSPLRHSSQGSSWGRQGSAISPLAASISGTAYEDARNCDKLLALMRHEEADAAIEKHLSVSRISNLARSSPRADAKSKSTITLANTDADPAIETHGALSHALQDTDQVATTTVRTTEFIEVSHKVTSIRGPPVAVGPSNILPIHQPADTNDHQPISAPASPRMHDSSFVANTHEEERDTTTPTMNYIAVVQDTAKAHLSLLDRSSTPGAPGISADFDATPMPNSNSSLRDGVDLAASRIPTSLHNADSTSVHHVNSGTPSPESTASTSNGQQADQGAASFVVPDFDASLERIQQMKVINGASLFHLVDDGELPDDTSVELRRKIYQYKLFISPTVNNEYLNRFVYTVHVPNFKLARIQPDDALQARLRNNASGYYLGLYFDCILVFRVEICHILSVATSLSKVIIECKTSIWINQTEAEYTCLELILEQHETAERLRKDLLYAISILQRTYQ